MALTVLLLATLWSGLVNYRGANSSACNLWNVRPMDVDLAPERVWDWKDPQFLRGRNPWRRRDGRGRGALPEVRGPRPRAVRDPGARSD